MSEPELRAALERANARLKGAIEALAPKHKGGEMAEYRAAHEAVLIAERNLAAALAEPYAVPLEFPVQWDTGAPLPYLLQNDYKTFLLFLLADAQAQPDGSVVTVVDPNDSTPSNMAIVEFKGCKTLGHYIFGFHDCTFECVAQSLAVEKMATTTAAALAAICRRLRD